MAFGHQSVQVRNHWLLPRIFSPLFHDNAPSSSNIQEKGALWDFFDRLPSPRRCLRRGLAQFGRHGAELAGEADQNTGLSVLFSISHRIDVHQFCLNILQKSRFEL